MSFSKDEQRGGNLTVWLLKDICIDLCAPNKRRWRCLETSRFHHFQELFRQIKSQNTQFVTAPQQYMETFLTFLMPCDKSKTIFWHGAALVKVQLGLRTTETWLGFRKHLCLRPDHYFVKIRGPLCVCWFLIQNHLGCCHWKLPLWVNWNQPDQQTV